ncbi:cysteine desulfurase [Amylolactobacillus amylotrophicus DSM 20534]|uniref:Cysteine desulfurase n=4 Tax=Amylolactobacillus TaxID=2767876 RepID=A0A1L6XDQ4_9LACO|nr:MULTISPECIES: cysteine desulfurase family protein [Amylolactobacillus]APT19114.1 cysteine desulfurase [Amylolactobacillus amylophilus DSM 20533 = JCM 1125]KRK38620.1 cysteine desulfurase [Amylolactobacillus amylotrophicus DSM 20534]KRM42737.1 cysteine desulfurase [Amylolactobacillus amylophilus DSM 20533 = JCM 1125]GED79600.1 cysteine desulfurase [Amylolactobacillus amylophilus]
MKHLYFDNAATTPMDQTVIDLMTKTMTEDFGNASSTHYFGRQAREIVDHARQIIGDSINAKPTEIIFTSGGSESNNAAIFGVAKSSPGKHIITTAIEHPSVINPLHELERAGYEVTYLDVNEHGMIDLDQLRATLRPDTILVSVMAVNNEVGSLMPLKEIGEIVSESSALFHVDDVQGYGNLKLDVKDAHIDLLSTSAHKINGPKFLGFLYVNQEVQLPKLIFGGEQERKKRAGTENVPAIAGFGQAVAEIEAQDPRKMQAKYRSFQDRILADLTENDVDFAVNGGVDDEHSAHVLNLWIKGVSTYVLQTNLDLAGIAVSGGSACTAGSLEPSHVLTAMFGADSPRVSESIRISFGRMNTLAEVQELSMQLVNLCVRLQHKVTNKK